MKRITLIIIVLLSFVQFSKAQIIVTSTSASTQKVMKERPKSNRVKGWVLQPDIELGGEVNYGSTAFGINLNFGYQLNPYIVLGIGGGYMFYGSYTDYDYSYNSRMRSSGPLHTIPIYANIRGYFCNRKVSPYYNIKIGYAIMGGFNLGFGFGVNWKNFDFGISEVALINEERTSILFHVSYNFQLSSKK